MEIAHNYLQTLTFEVVNITPHWGKQEAVWQHPLFGSALSRAGYRR
ncbi:hypothetical protein ACFQMB_08515 [Pseudobowmanella zhangzhouensis]